MEKSILKPQDIIKILKFPTKEQECFLVILLNGRLQIIEQKLVFLGSLNECSIHTREIFKDAIKKNSAGIIIAHNHPSDDPTPSIEDKKITQGLIKAGEILGIKVLDHIIIGDKYYYSFFEESEKTNLNKNLLGF
jgi:DNA repair protein RadC